MQIVFSFLPYCQQYWLHHTKHVDSGEARLYKLWADLVSGTASIVELPWAPECAGKLSSAGDLGERFVCWIIEQRHFALIDNAIQWLWHGRARGLIGSDIGYSQLDRLLTLSGLPSRGVLPSLDCGGLERLLWESSKGGYQAIVQLTLQEGVNVDTEFALHGNALHAAVSSGNRAIVELLIDHGADVNLNGGKFGTTLQAAAATGMNPYANLPLETGADVNGHGGEYGTALIAAVATNDVVTMRLLLNTGAIVELGAIIKRGGECFTPLTMAVHLDSPLATSVLLDAGADANSPIPWPFSPLELAAKRGNERIVKQLLDKGAHLGGSLQNILEALGTPQPIASLIHKV